MSMKNEFEPLPVAPPNGNDWGSRRDVQSLVLIAAIAGGLYLCYRLALPFLSAITWALTLAILFMPLHRRLETKLKRANLAAAVSILVVGLIVAVPVTFLGQRLLIESAKGAEVIKAKVESGEWRRALEAQPRIASLASWMERQVDLPQTVQALTTGLTRATGTILKGSLVQLLAFCLTFYLLFFFLRDRQAALESMRFLAPLSRADMDRLFDRVEDTVFATMFGTLAMAAVQGLLGGLMFWWLGLPAPLLWGLVMAVLAVVPVMGAFVVWVPAACVLALQGSWGKALILTVWGAVIVGGIDNLLLPMLVGKRLRLHTVLAFLSVVGGLVLFGPSGLILGPVVLTTTTVLLETWRHRAFESV